MTVISMGKTFPTSSQWHKHQIELMKNINDQIVARFPKEKNVLVNLTWFGPQFENDEYNKFLEYASNNQIDNLFLLASEDPCFFDKQQTKKFINDSKSKNYYLLGHFDTKYHFNFFSTVIGKYFRTYTEDELQLIHPKYIYINYNRKPRDHRKKLVTMLNERNLSQFGIVTLGNDYTLGETVEDIGVENQWWPDEYGIPHDIHSLGRLEYWQQHFLNIVSETDFEDSLWTYVTEKTYKPIIGLRPFVINGQLEVYRLLRKQGFKTFNQYWPHIDIENCNIDNIHSNICELIKWLQTQDLTQMYIDMLPDLRYNKQRFYEFSAEQKYKMENLFG